MAKYTITLEQTLELMTPEQSVTYNALLRAAVPTEYGDDFVAAFNARYRTREISNGTPAGFLEDLTSAVYSNKLELNALWAQYAEDGMFIDARRSSDTETPNVTKTRTPDLTDTRTPNITRNGHSVTDDTPQTSGVISGGYAAIVVDDSQSETGNEQLKRTGTETERETGTRTRVTEEQVGNDLNRIMREGVANLMIYTLQKFTSCFILLY